jgi:hypothetical protein
MFLLVIVRSMRKKRKRQSVDTIEAQAPALEDTKEIPVPHEPELGGEEVRELDAAPIPQELPAIKQRGPVAASTMHAEAYEKGPVYELEADLPRKRKVKE